jgi:hypothetical protein
MTTDDRSPASPTEPPPPILGSWRNLYTAVLAALVVEVILFYAFTRMFA